MTMPPKKVGDESKRNRLESMASPIATIRSLSLTKPASEFTELAAKLRRRDTLTDADRPTFEGFTISFPGATLLGMKPEELAVEYFLTMDGWVVGSSYLDGHLLCEVPVPATALQGWRRIHDLCGILPAHWELRWHSGALDDELEAMVRARYPSPPHSARAGGMSA